MAWLADERHWFMMAVVLYGFSTIYSIFLWRGGFRHHNQVNYFLLLGGFVLHTVALVKRGFSLSRCPVNNLFEAITFMEWTIVLAYLAVGLWSRLRFLGAFTSPVLFAVGVFALMPDLDKQTGQRFELLSGWASLHAALILLAYGAFGLSSVAGVMYLTQEHDLKYHKLRAVVSLFPPLQRLELVVGRLLVAGFVLLTLGLGVGALYLKTAYGSFPLGDAKILWSIFVWALYGTILLMRWQFSQSGKRIALGAVGSFAFVLLTFWGFNLLSGVHHP